jgi:hypothetical protein
MLDIFSTSATDLLTTLDHNLAHPTDSRFQMSVAYDRVSSEGVVEFKKVSREHAMNLLRSLDQTLSSYDRDANSSIPEDNEDQHRIGLGIYLIEDGTTEPGLND